MGRPSTQKPEIKNTEVKDNKENELLQKQLEEEKSRNNDLENKLNDLMKMVAGLTEKQSEPIQETKKIKSSLDSYKEIEPTKRILLMNMIDAGGTYITHSGKPIRFDYQGQVQPVRFEDVESLRNKYRNSFENLEIRILDDDEVVNALYLKSFYDKYDISLEEMESIIELNAQNMIRKIKEMPKSLREATLCMIISNVAKKNAKYMDKNKWEVINNEFNINIEELSRTYYFN